MAFDILRNVDRTKFAYASNSSSFLGRRDVFKEKREEKKEDEGRSDCEGDDFVMALNKAFGEPVVGADFFDETHVAERRCLQCIEQGKENEENRDDDGGDEDGFFHASFGVVTADITPSGT